MGAAAIHYSLLTLGALFVAVPILLHLTMRRKPKQIVFPALRFVKQRRQTNQTQLRVRHWLLLLLRCLAILLFVLLLALANLTVPAAFLGNWLLLGVLSFGAIVALVMLAASLIDRSGRLLIGALAGLSILLLGSIAGVGAWTFAGGGAGRIGDKEAPVAAVLVVDTSPRMLYRRDNQTRLDKAREIAGWLLRRLPTDSQVIVSDARSGEPIETVNRTAAEAEIERLEPTAVSAPLVEKITKAIRYAQDAPFQQREVYLFTDLTVAGWNGAASAGLQQQLDTASDVLFYVIDVGVEQPLDFALGDLNLSQQTLTKNGALVIETEVSVLGASGARTIQLHVEDPAPELPRDVDGRRELPPSRLRAEELVELVDGASQRVRFPPLQLPEGVHFGQVRILGDDGLAVDDQRYFTVEARQAWPVLLASPPGVETRFFTEAITPFQFRETDRARFDLRAIEQNNLSNETLGEYAAVCLIDPLPLTPGQWEQLTDYVEQGGKLAIFLGRNATAESFNQPDAQRLLAGPLLPIPWREPSRKLLLAPKDYQHPALAPLRPVATTVPWGELPVFRHWVLVSLAPESSAILSFSNGKPAIVERTVGRGRVVTMTTPISDPLWRRGEPRPWNEIPTAENNWPYLVVINELMLSLVQSGAWPLNYYAGQSAVLTNEPDRDPETYTLFAPGEAPQAIKAYDGKVQIGYTETLGAYRLKGSLNGPISRGFSVNLRAAETNLQRLPPDALTSYLGADRYQLAKETGDIERRQSLAREDPQLYPYFLLALAVILALEQLMANRFYSSKSGTQVAA
ncbi:vWA domain-containing protein [Lignipirellula cremea]|uniref:Aerotolerance regulator N-terminal domain-containing protein n=1 Tax=Lignipirellula cremea TaxID=2528010 RepID=A0A518DX75_9BACT|nr:VWA domain-containing protein [Lignipirellula cremea]QDU96435.1 hypothetical protein Pla8534_42560 [Lignipirellula cremea]